MSNTDSRIVQASLPVSSDLFPKTVTGNGKEFRLLGVDERRQGHYWLQGDRLSRIVGVADTSLGVVSADTWLAESQVADYLNRNEWSTISEYGRSFL